LVSRLRTLLVVVWLVVYTILIAPPGLLLARLTGSRSLLYRLAVPPTRVALWLGGVRIRVKGLERIDDARNYLFMPNHNSNADPPVVVVALGRQPRFMAKASLFRIPLFGHVMSSAGFVPVERERRDAAIAAVAAASERLSEGYDFVVFPEGTRSRDGRLLPLKKGPFFMAVESGVAVVPVVVQGTRHILRKGGAVIHGGAVDVEICKPIEVVDLTGPTERKRALLRDRVAEVLAAGLTVPPACATPEGDGQE
jgi:1-acyl-sn-glycerol-3-phosphate acyltransferase